MLERRCYSRQELVDLFKTDRLDSIKNKLNRQGYQYTTDGRGKTFTLTITELPPRFRSFCIEELGFHPQTDFKGLKEFLYRFFLDEKFQKLPSTAMAREVNMSYQTINRWIDKLIKQNMIMRDWFEFNYFAHGRDSADNIITFPIDKDTYSNAWSAYWDGRQYSYSEAVNRMGAVVNGTPCKVGIVLENVFELRKLNTLREILEKEKNIND